MSDPLKNSPPSNFLYTPVSQDKDNDIFDKIASGSSLKDNNLGNEWHYTNRWDNSNRNLQIVNYEEIKENLQITFAFYTNKKKQY